jgi:hypothetical protein
MLAFGKLKVASREDLVKSMQSLTLGRVQEIYGPGGIQLDPSEK